MSKLNSFSFSFCTYGAACALSSLVIPAGFEAQDGVQARGVKAESRAIDIISSPQPRIKKLPPVTGLQTTARFIGRSICGRTRELAHDVLATKKRQSDCSVVVVCKSDSGGIRTHDPQLRRLLLYPAELRNHRQKSPFYLSKLLITTVARSGIGRFCGAKINKIY